MQDGRSGGIRQKGGEVNIEQSNVTIGEVIGRGLRRGWLVCGRSRVPVVVTYTVGDADVAAWDEYDWADHYSDATIDKPQAIADGIADAEIAACEAFFA